MHSSRSDRSFLKRPSECAGVTPRENLASGSRPSSGASSTTSSTEDAPIVRTTRRPAPKTTAVASPIPIQAARGNFGKFGLRAFGTSTGRMRAGAADGVLGRFEGTASTPWLHPGQRTRWPTDSSLTRSFFPQSVQSTETDTDGLQVIRVDPTSTADSPARRIRIDIDRSCRNNLHADLPGSQAGDAARHPAGSGPIRRRHARSLGPDGDDGGDPQSSGGAR